MKVSIYLKQSDIERINRVAKVLEERQISDVFHKDGSINRSKLLMFLVKTAETDLNLPRNQENSE